MNPQLEPEIVSTFMMECHDVFQLYLRSAVAIDLIVGLAHLAIVCWLAHRRALLPRNISALDFRNLLTNLEREIITCENLETLSRPQLTSLLMSLQSWVGTWLHTVLGTFSHTSRGTLEHTSFACCSHSFLGTWRGTWRHSCFSTWVHCSLGICLHSCLSTWLHSCRGTFLKHANTS